MGDELNMLDKAFERHWEDVGTCDTTKGEAFLSYVKGWKDSASYLDGSLDIKDEEEPSDDEDDDDDDSDDENSESPKKK